jgi:hypothetical protein
MAPRKSVSKAARLRDLAGRAENIGALASLADAQLKRASADLQTLAAAAKLLADQIEKAADGEAVQL